MNSSPEGTGKSCLNLSIAALYMFVIIDVKSLRHSDQFQVLCVPPRFVTTEAARQLSNKLGFSVADNDTFLTARRVVAIPCISAYAAL